MRTLVVTLLLSVVVAPSALAAWVNPAWTYRQRITISSSVASVDHTDFPYLIRISNLANPVFANAQPDGDDLVLTAADGSTVLDHEIEHYDAGTGELSVWVKLPTLSASVDTDLFLYYGNAVVASQENVAGVWSNGYEAVWHLHDDFLDSIGGHGGTNTGSVDAAGAVADGQDFDPDDGIDKIGVGTWNVSGTALTIQAWGLVDEDFEIDDPRILSKAPDNTPQNHVYMLSLTDGTFNENRLRARLKTGTDDATNTTTMYGSSPNGYLPSTNTWYHMAMTYDGVVMRLVRDGLDAGSVAKTGNIRQNAWPINIGNDESTGTTSFGSWEGRLDEVRVSSATRSIAWLRTEYLNQSTPATYQTLGTEEIELKLVKRAFDADGNAIAHLDTLASGTIIRFLIYVNNPGPAYNDLTAEDVLDPSAFVYLPGTMRVDNALAACAAPACTGVEEAAILASVVGTIPLTDAVDVDEASFDVPTNTVHVGDGTVANGTVNIAANSVSSLVFTVRIQ